jgi:UDP-N-acetylmuramoyl-tripeptide--D-alanyl-D-alanine ligase
VTTIGTDHYQQFRGLEATAREKAALVAALPESGTAILNADDPHVLAMAPQTRARVLTYGLSTDADIRATNVSSIWPRRLSLDVTYGSRRVRVQTKLAGEYWVTSILSAIACGIVCGMRIEDCAEEVEKFEPVFARTSIHSKPGNPVFILDTRKAPSWTLPHSLALIERARAPRKTLIFGTLSHRPGGWTSDRYRKLAREALAVADRVIFVGPNAAHVDKLRTQEVAQRLLSFPTAYQASEFVARSALPDELILVKASSADHLERVMLRMQDRVVCWRERCRRQMDCPDCRLYRTPGPPPFHAADSPIAHDPTAAELLG